jgi:hypothetical protein
MAVIQCPFCYERISESVTECQSHCEENHRDKIDKVLAKDFTLADYWREEVAFFTIKNILSGKSEVEGEVEDLVLKFLPDCLPIRKRLLKLRLQVCIWPCKHEGEDPDNLDDCCDARRRFGEFMNVMCDAYGSDGDESDGGDGSE